MYEVKDKVFLITGGAAGIGAGVTRAFLADGAKHVAVLDLDVANGKALETELATKFDAKKIKFYKCDVTTKELEDGIDAVWKEFGYIDCVVNCAGIMNDSPHMFVKEIEVNVTALIRSSMKSFEMMSKEKGGRGGTIINISSITALFRCIAVPVYAATKSAVLQFTNCLGVEPYYSRSGVRMIAICFGTTDTTLLQSYKYSGISKEYTFLVDNDMKNSVFQKPESAVNGLVEAYKRGSGASTWLIHADKPAEDISKNVEKSYEILSQGFL